ncbi:TRAP transporter permease [Proteocatella sphenisci]|uniref:TRAP transporter permease n=1 Tax=Proteocatella sphenisci TaxID=181070 RepID=UPI0004AF3636|nr:TRAP transporter permease [Proteocatella sphenisci]
MKFGRKKDGENLTGSSQVEEGLVQDDEVIDKDELLAKLDKESAYRKLDGIWKKITTVMLFCFTAFQLYTALMGTFPAQLQRMIHLGFVITLAYLLYPATSKGSRKKIAFLDYIFSGAFFCIVAYYIMNYEAIIGRSGSYNQVDVIVGVIGTILVMEACRRVVGWPIVIIAMVFISYAYFGRNIPGFFNHRGYSLERIATHLFYTTEGIIGLPLGTCATYIFLFILFGAFLEKTGIGQFFIDVANSVAGFAAGGPAKVAVLTSALQGTISGSSVSNTVSTGSFTIPLMKSLGYKPEFAAAVEAAASTGGQIMPPIMGAAAFLIAEAVGVPYLEVAKAAIIPALLYFTGIWMMIHLEAKKIGLVGIPKDQLPKVGPILKERGHLILPIVVIIVLLAMDRSPIYAATRGILAAVIAPYLRKSTYVPLRDLFDALINGARNIISVACACGVAGIIVGIVTLTGLGLKLGGGLISAAGGMVSLTLFFTMITSLVLGMGVPTTANYLITSTIAAPIVMQLGVPPLAAHLFTFYFGILADITPPVALAAYAGSAIAKGNPFKTGVQATKLAIAAFIIPYIFVMNPALILIDTNFIEVIRITATSLVGMFGISAGMTGWVYGKASKLERLLLIAAGLMLINPTVMTDIIGTGGIALMIAYQHIKYKKIKPAKVA